MTKLFQPEGEKLFVMLIISGMIFLTMTGYNMRFIPCSSELDYCRFNYLSIGESYNAVSLIAVLLIFSIIPYFLSCIIVEWFKKY